MVQVHHCADHTTCPSLTFSHFRLLLWNRWTKFNVLYQVCVFRADRKNKMAALASDWLKHFQLLLRNGSIKFNKTWQEARFHRSLPSLCFFGANQKNKMAALASDWLRHFYFSETTQRNSMKLDRKQDLNVLANRQEAWRWHIVLRCTICGPLGLFFMTF